MNGHVNRIKEQRDGQKRLGTAVKDKGPCLNAGIDVGPDWCWKRKVGKIATGDQLD